MHCPHDGTRLEPVTGAHEQHKHPNMQNQVGEVFRCTNEPNHHRFHMHMRDGQRFFKEDLHGDTGKDYADDESFDLPSQPKHA